MLNPTVLVPGETKITERPEVFATPHVADDPIGRRVVWEVGALCRAIGSSLDSRFNPVAVRGELTGFSRAASGHSYFSLKDADGQIRCAMFRRAATLVDFTPRDGELVDVRGRLGVYEQRGDLQLVVESMSRAGAGSLFEQFLERKARLQSEGLFDAVRKKQIPGHPRAIGLVTSLGAAALHDVAASLRRRVPHIPVVLSPAIVQGNGAPGEIVAALTALYRRCEVEGGPLPIDLILLVRGGGSLEDLWAFNDEALVRTIAESPVPVISGIGHETDFTLSDFVADLRAPTPTSAAEMAAEPMQSRIERLDLLQKGLRTKVSTWLDRSAQRIDGAAGRLGRPTSFVSGQRGRSDRLAQALFHTARMRLRMLADSQRENANALLPAIQYQLQNHVRSVERSGIRLVTLDPKQVLRRGYAFLQKNDGQIIRAARDVSKADVLRATLSNGTLQLAVLPSKNRSES